MIETLTRDSFWGPAGVTGTGVRRRRRGEWEQGDGETEGVGMGLRAVCSILQCALHCAVLSCDCNGYHPLYPIRPFFPLCMAMCWFNSDWEGLGAGMRCVFGVYMCGIH